MVYSHLIQTPFLVRPTPCHQESPLGYLLRIAEDNGWPSYASLVRQLPVTSKGKATYAWNIATSAERMQEIEQLLVKPADSVTNISYSNVSQGRSTTRRFRHAVLPTDLFEFQASRFCPACLELSPYRRDLWDLAPVQSCPEHGLLLQQCCPHCGAEQKWAKTKTTTCGTCFESLLEAPQIKASSDLRWLTEMISGLLDRCSRQPAAAFIPDDPRKFLEVVRLLALFVSGEGCKGRDLPVLPDMMNQDMERNLYEKAAAALKHWPESASDIVREQVAKQWKHYPALGPQVWEKRAQRILSRGEYPDASYLPWTAPLRDALAAVKSSAFMSHGCGVANSSFETDATETVLFSFQEAAKLFGMSPRAMRLSRTLQMLEKMELLIRIRSTRWIDGKQLDTLFEKIQSAIRVGQATETITLANMQSTLLGRYGFDVLGIVQAVINLQIAPVSWSRGTPLSLMQFDLQEIRRYLGQVSTNFDGYAIPEAAENLGCFTDALRRVIKAGLLQTSWVRGIDGHYRTMVASMDLENFKQEYAISATLAKEVNDEPRRFSDKLMDEGVMPVSGPGIDGGLVYVFRRNDLNDIDLQAVANKTIYKKRCGRKTKKDAKFLELQSLKEGLLTAEDVATLLGISTQMVSRLAKQGYLTEVDHYGQFGNRRYFQPEEVKRYIAEYRENPALMLEQEAANILGISLPSFRSTMIRTRRVTIITDGMHRYVKNNDIHFD